MKKQDFRYLSRHKSTVFMTVYPDSHAHMQQEEGVTGKLARLELL